MNNILMKFLIVLIGLVSMFALGASTVMFGDIGMNAMMYGIIGCMCAVCFTLVSRQLKKIKDDQKSHANKLAILIKKLQKS